MKKKSTQRLAPDENSHELTASRVNYMCYVLLNYQSKEAPPSPFSHGWTQTNGMNVVNSLNAQYSFGSICEYFLLNQKVYNINYQTVIYLDRYPRSARVLFSID